MRKGFVLAALFGVLFSWQPWKAHAGEVVDVKSRGETVRILVEKPKDRFDIIADRLIVAPKVVGVTVLFAGNTGVLALDGVGGIGLMENDFIVRSEDLLREKGFITVIIDGPTDHPHNLNRFRGSEDHATDVAAVIALLRKKYGLPVWLIGSSRGTNSVANAAARLQGPKGPDGIVLTSTMLEDNSVGDQVLYYNLGEIHIPVVIAHHRSDECHLTPPDKVDDLVDALKDAKILAVLWYKGGRWNGQPCRAFHYHGFNGLEEQVVNDIAVAIKTTIPNAH